MRLLPFATGAVCSHSASGLHLKQEGVLGSPSSCTISLVVWSQETLKRLGAGAEEPDFPGNCWAQVPAEFKCRQMVPSSGSRSTSLWDTSSPDGPDLLLEWLTTNINASLSGSVGNWQCW